jgi:four helix bundle protein
LGHQYSFEKLNVWLESRNLVRWICRVTTTFPPDERFGLIMQLRRAAISVVSNLGEGSARKSPKDQAHFTQIAYSSLIEILNQLIIANDLSFLSDELLIEGRTKIETHTSQIAALRTSQLVKGKLS